MMFGEQWSLVIGDSNSDLLILGKAFQLWKQVFIIAAPAPHACHHTPGYRPGFGKVGAHCISQMMGGVDIDLMR